MTSDTTTTQPRGICPACACPLSEGCGCVCNAETTPAATLTASSSAGSTTAQWYESVLVAAGYSQPSAWPTTTVTAGATYPFPDPSTGISVEASQNLTDSKEMSEVRRVTMTSFPVDSLEYALLAATNHALIPAALDRKANPHRLAAASCAGTDADELVAEAVANVLYPALTAAATSPLGAIGRPTIAEAPNAVDPADPHGVLALQGDTFIGGAMQTLASYVAAGDWLHAFQATNSIRDAIRAKAVGLGLVASAPPARSGDAWVAAATSNLEHVNTKGDPLATAAAARKVVEFAERAEAAHVDAEFARITAGGADAPAPRPALARRLEARKLAQRQANAARYAAAAARLNGLNKMAD